MSRMFFTKQTALFVFFAFSAIHSQLSAQTVSSPDGRLALTIAAAPMAPRRPLLR
jgi:hypothetical protein